MTASPGRVVLIGASAGGVSALLEIAEALPAPFPAPVCIVQHIGPHQSLLPELLRFRGDNNAVHAQDGHKLLPGTLYVAPPDMHVIVEGDVLHVTHGPKENHARPAIDPLFRSAGLSFGTGAIGVILTGLMDDGAAGLKAVKDCGGLAVVQDPQTASEPSMPRAALDATVVDHCVPLEDIAPLLARLVGRPAAAALPAAPKQVAVEVAINRGEITMEHLAEIGKPSPLTCPECSGGLWEVNDPKPLRYRCHTGHAFTSLTLAQAQRDAAEESLWSSVRALREREVLLRRLARIADATGDANQARAGVAEADRLGQQIRTIQRIAEEIPKGMELDAAA